MRSSGDFRSARSGSPRFDLLGVDLLGVDLLGVDLLGVDLAPFETAPSDLALLDLARFRFDDFADLTAAVHRERGIRT
jgi:hypothetical protein